jgi:filamentous hemagglutinin family protein
MNSNLFKTVFSKHLGALVAVGEHASSQGKATGGHGVGGFSPMGVLSAGGAYFVGPLVISFALITLAWASPAPNALPSGGQLAQGAAAISQSGTNMAIHQSTSRAVINWQSFDIGKDAKVNIVQPNAQAVLLNRVTGVAPSQIFGQMSANGQVVLVNPNGVTFGKDGSVSAAGLTASTLNISDADFMAAVVSSKMARSTTRSLANAAPAHNQMTKTAKNIFDVFIIS